MYAAVVALAITSAAPSEPIQFQQSFSYSYNTQVVPMAPAPVIPFAAPIPFGVCPLGVCPPATFSQNGYQRSFQQTTTTQQSAGCAGSFSSQSRSSFSLRSSTRSGGCSGLMGSSTSFKEKTTFRTRGRGCS